MFKSRLALISVGVTSLFGFLCLRNFQLLPNQSKKFKIGKSAVETGLIITCLQWAPGLLVGLIAAWLVKDIKNNWAKAIIAIIASIFLGVISVFSLDVIAALSIPAINLKTGESQGAIGRYREIRQREQTISRLKPEAA